MSEQAHIPTTDTMDEDKVRGGFTDLAETHLWCAAALATLVGAPEVAFDELNDDSQSAIRYLLRSEIVRAKHAHSAEAQERSARHG